MTRFNFNICRVEEIDKIIMNLFESLVPNFQSLQEEKLNRHTSSTSCIHSYTHSHLLSLTRWLTPTHMACLSALTCSLARSLTHWPTHSPAHRPARSLAHSLTHSLKFTPRMPPRLHLDRQVTIILTTEPWWCSGQLDGHGHGWWIELCSGFYSRIQHNHFSYNTFTAVNNPQQKTCEH